MTVTEQGAVSEVLVVKSAAAAANPALASIRIGTATTGGIAVSADAGGNITGTDTSGNVVFHAAAPHMWDSGDTSDSLETQAAPDSTDTDDPTDTPPPGAQIAPIDVAVTAGAVTLIPNQQLLTDTDTNYPVYIDPSWVQWGPTSKSAFAWVQQAYPTDGHWNDTSSEPAVGYQGWDTPYGITRSFFQFNIGNIGDYHVHSATLKATEVYSGKIDDGSCTTTHTIRELNVGHITSSVDWNHQPTLYTQTSSDSLTYARGCPDPVGAWDVTGSVSADGDGVVTYRLAAADETNRNAYMRFSHNATLSIQYNRIPNAPTNFAISPAPQNPSGGSCTGTYGWVGATSTLTLAGRLTDPDGQQLEGRFQIWDKGGSGTATAISIINTDDSRGYSTWINSGSTASKGISTGLLTNGHLYGTNTHAWDGFDLGPWSGENCYFWYDKTAPTTPSATSTDFPANGGGAKHVNQSGTIHVTSADVVPSGASYSKINHFAYSTSSASALAGDGGTHKTATVSGATGTADITLTPTVWGINYLYVAAVDNAGNQSATSTYRYFVPDDSTAVVNPGDIDNDGHPDLLAANSASKNLELYPTVKAIPTTPTVASNPVNSPDGTTWANTLLAHRSSSNQSPSGGRVDDLWAHKSSAGTLYLYTNNINNAGGLAGNSNLYYTSNNRVAVAKPFTCADPDCTGYNTTDWTSLTQMITPGDLDGDGLPDLVTVEGDKLWLYPGTTITGQLGLPHLLGASSWNNWHIMAPGDNTGDGIPDIWATDARTIADGGTGAMRLYRAILDTTTGTVSLATPVTGPTSGFGPDNRVLATSPGDVDGDGYPDLYTTTPATPHQLWENPATTNNPTTLGIGAHILIDDGTTHDWSNITNLS